MEIPFQLFEPVLVKIVVIPGTRSTISNTIKNNAQIANYDHIIHDGKQKERLEFRPDMCQSTLFDVYQAAVVSFGYNCCLSTLLNCQFVSKN